MTTTTLGRVDPAPAPGPGPRRHGGAATTLRPRPPRRVRHGLTLFGLPVVVLVAVEVVLLCALLVGQRKLALTIVAVVVGAAVIVLGLVRVRSVRLGTWLALRAGYLLRQRETLVAAAEYTRGGAGNGTADTADGAEGGEKLDLAPELAAFFPGMSVWEGRTHDDERMGVLQWHGTCAATVRIGPQVGMVRSRNTTADIPLETIMAGLDEQNLGLDAVQILTQTIVGEQDQALSRLVPAAATELFGGRPRLRNRSAFVTVRLDPATAAEAIAARGGGELGIARVLSAALSRVRSAAESAGLAAIVLDADEANRAVAESFYHPATPYDPIIRWVESVRQVASSRIAHRSFVVSDIRRPVLSELPIGNVFAYSVAVQARPMPDGWATRTVVRVTCKSPQALGAATRELRGAARRSGITLRPLDAAQHLGIRATVPAGGIW